MGTVVRSSTSSTVRRSWGTLRQRRDDIRRASSRSNARRVFRVPAMSGHMGRFLWGSVTGTHWSSQRRTVRGIRRARRLYLLNAFNRIFAWRIGRGTDEHLIADSNGKTAGEKEGTSENRSHNSALNDGDSGRLGSRLISGAVACLVFLCARDKILRFCGTSWLFWSYNGICSGWKIFERLP